MSKSFDFLNKTEIQKFSSHDPRRLDSGSGDIE